MAAPVRVTQQVIEVIRKATTPPVRVTQQVIEVIRKATTPIARITQQVPEVIRKGISPPLRVSQQFIDVLRALPPGPRSGRITQIYTDTVRSNPPTQVWVTQVFTETIRNNVQQPKPGLKSWMVFDRLAFLDVTVIAGAPTSAADVHAVLNGANLISLGSELLQFMTATDMGGNVFRLSNLLRGRLGTEQFMNSHTNGELAYFLTNAATRRALSDLADLNMIKYWKVIGIGQLLSSKAPITKINTGISLKPWAPVRIKGTRDGGLNLTVVWGPRSNVGHQRIFIVKPPSSDLPEKYRVEVIDSSGAAIRTFEPLTNLQVYTAAEQIADFGVEQVAVPIRVGQLSDTVGLGYTNTEIL